MITKVGSGNVKLQNFEKDNVEYQRNITAFIFKYAKLDGN